MIAPSSVTFCGQPGQAVSTVPISISTSSGALDSIFTVFSQDGDWLTGDPLFATLTTTPNYQFVVGLKTGLIPFGTGAYRGQVTITTFGGARLATVPVTLQVSAAGCSATNTGELFSSTGPVAFQIAPGGSGVEPFVIYNLFPQSVYTVPTVTTDSGNSWLTTLTQPVTFVPGLQYPAPLSIGASAAGLGPGAYTGRIDFTNSNASSLSLPVTLTVSASAGNAQLAATPSPLTIGIQTGAPPSNAVIQLTNLTSGPLTIGVSSTAKWLTVTPSAGAMPARGTISLTASINPAALSRGTNPGTIGVQVTSGSGSLSIPVTVNYGLESPLAATPNPLAFIAPGSQTISVSSTTGAAVSFSTKLFSSANQPWLAVKPYYATASPGAPASLTVSVDPSFLPAGPAFGLLSLLPYDGSAPLQIPVFVNAGVEASLTVSPSQLSFTSSATQTLTLTAADSATYAIQPSASWLNVNPATVTGSGTVAVQIDPSGLTPDTYNGQIAIVNTSTGAQRTVPINLTVGAPVALTATPAALAFDYQAGSDTVPPPQTLQITGGAATFTVSAVVANGAPDFLSITPTSAAAPANVQVRLNAAAVKALPAGQYTETISLATSGGGQTVSVTLTISAAPRPVSLVNAASLIPGPVAPGEIVTIFGTGLGPGVTVTFEGYAAPLTYVSAQQINLIVPYEIAGLPSANMVVTRNGAASTPIALAVADTAPGVFAGAILNADSSVNSAGNPVAVGSAIQLFGTGEGVYPGATTGSVTATAPPFPVLAAPVSVSIGGLPAAVLYAGEAPGSLSGLLQVNAVIPAGLASGPQPVVLKVGDRDNTSQGVTVIVR
jgi:uncharacterized protein (TIGR03437 family)